MVRLTDHFDMTIAVDLDVKNKIKQTKLPATDIHILGPVGLCFRKKMHLVGVENP